MGKTNCSCNMLSTTGYRPLVFLRFVFFVVLCFAILQQVSAKAKVLPYLYECWIPHRIRRSRASSTHTSVEIEEARQVQMLLVRMHPRHRTLRFCTRRFLPEQKKATTFPFPLPLLFFIFLLSSSSLSHSSSSSFPLPLSLRFLKIHHKSPDLVCNVLFFLQVFHAVNERQCVQIQKLKDWLVGTEEKNLRKSSEKTRIFQFLWSFCNFLLFDFWTCMSWLSASELTVLGGTPENSKFHKFCGVSSEIFFGRYTTNFMNFWIFQFSWIFSCRKL